MPQERIEHFVTTLRNALDAKGFKNVKLHMSNASTVKTAFKRVHKYIGNKKVWYLIDYSATNMYDYQPHFTNPDGFDSTLIASNNKINSRTFLSTELCMNDSKYQEDSYRLAFIAYCWLLLNVEWPSFGATRSLFVSSPENGFMPVPSSNGLRVFGAWSRRLKEICNG